MKLLIPDANLGEGSSLSPAAQATDVQPNDANRDDSSASQVDKKGDDKIESIADIKAKLLEKYPVADEKQPEDPTPSKEPSADVKAPAEDSTKKPLDSTEKKKVEESVVTDDSKLPFHKHPRFVKLTQERAEYSEKVQKLEPIAKRMQAVEEFCVKSGIEPQEYDDTLKLLAEMKSAPATALPKIKKIVETMEIALGSALPQDLQTRVDNGTLSLTDAQEMSKLRLGKQTVEQQQQRQQVNAKQSAERQLVDGLNSWTRSRIASDPSFKPKTSASEPDGKYEMVANQFMAKWTANPPKTVEEAVKLADSAYTDVTGFIDRATPKPVTRRPLSPKRDVQEQEKQVDTSKPGWAKEVARRVLEKHG